MVDSGFASSFVFGFCIVCSPFAFMRFGLAGSLPHQQFHFKPNYVIVCAKRDPQLSRGAKMKRMVSGLAIFLFSLLACASVWAQATAPISGTARDQSGAVLPGVEVTATQTETGVARSTVTNETGSYVLSNMPLGPYRLEAGLPGFRTFVQNGIVLQVNSSPVINPVLEVGQVSEQVEVQANAAQVETRSAGVGQVIETQRILDLPLNGRNVTDLITLSGAAVQTGTSRGFGMRTGVNISVAGSIGDGVQY